MPTTLTVSQLRSALTAEQIDAANSDGIKSGDAPVSEEIAAAVAKVDYYIGARIVPAALATGYARDIAAHQVAKRLGSATEDQVRAYERALKELEDIRDGKFSHASSESDPAVAFGSLPSITRTPARLI